MRKFYDHRLGKTVISIDIGERAVSAEDVYISTVLGSCVSVVLYDPHIMIGGMNHFQRPYPLGSDDPRNQRGFYGTTAIPELLNDLEVAGCERMRLKAKIFGGACQIGYQTKMSIMNIGADNIAFTLEFLERLGIPIVKSDMGGNQGRRIYCDVRTFTVFVRKLHRQIGNIIPENIQLAPSVKRK